MDNDYDLLDRLKISEEVLARHPNAAIVNPNLLSIDKSVLNDNLSKSKNGEQNE